jgi:hypothetical protein
VVEWLVYVELPSAGETDVCKVPPFRNSHFSASYPVLLHFLQELPEIVAHQIKPVQVVALVWVDRQFCRGQGENKPTIPIVDEG